MVENCLVLEMAEQLLPYLLILDKLNKNNYFRTEKHLFSTNQEVHHMI
jgi:hypothetical protein